MTLFILDIYKIDNYKMIFLGKDMKRECDRTVLELLELTYGDRRRDRKMFLSLACPLITITIKPLLIFHFNLALV